MKKILSIVALAGLSACTMYPDGTTIVHSPPVVYSAPVVAAPVYVAPRPYYYGGYRPYYYHRYYR